MSEKPVSEEAKLTEQSVNPGLSKAEGESILAESDLEHISGGIGLEYHQL